MQAIILAAGMELASILLNRFDILVKDCGHKKSFENKNFIPIAVRDRNDNSSIIKALSSL